MKLLKITLAATTAALALSSIAHAEDRPLGLTFNVGMASDYVFRGISQTNNKAEAFGGADLTLAKIGYAGAWISNVDFLNGTKMEYDLYAGVKPVLGPVSFDFGVIRYGYTSQPAGPHETYWEFKGLGSIAAGPATVGVAFYHSPDNFGETGKADYFEVNGAIPIPNSKFSVSGAFGRQSVVGPADYNTWNIGATYAVTDKVGIDVRYIDTNKHEFGKIYEPKAVATVKVTF
jgi:uncharacterized protein (TIGR02001 family)